MELKAATNRTPSIENVEDLVSRLEGLVYMQFSESGAMGRAGDVVLGDLVGPDLISYYLNYHQWEGDEQRLKAAMDKLYGFVHQATSSTNPFFPIMTGRKAEEDPRFKAAFEVGNHLLLNRSFSFELGEDAIYFLGDGQKTPLTLTSAPLSIFGPRLFQDLDGKAGR